jgi:hypothetical protein
MRKLKAEYSGSDTELITRYQQTEDSAFVAALYYRYHQLIASLAV